VDEPERRRYPIVTKWKADVLDRTHSLAIGPVSAGDI
jgi:hypothetical protein